MRKIIPYPLLSLAILAMWLLLSGASAGQALLGGIVALICGLAMTRLRPQKIRIRKPYLLAVLFWRTLSDSVLSNIAAAKIILSGGRKKHPSGFIIVQLRLQSRMATAILACIITAAPGTAWIAYDRNSRRLILHILDLDDAAAWDRFIKSRYEDLLLEIFK